MDLPATCEKYVKDRISFKYNLRQIKVHFKCNYLKCVGYKYKQFSNKTWHCYNCSKNLFPFTTINNVMLYPLLSDKNYCDNDLNDSCPELKAPKNLLNLFNKLTPFHLLLKIPQKM